MSIAKFSIVLSKRRVFIYLIGLFVLSFQSYLLEFSFVLSEKEFLVVLFVVKFSIVLRIRDFSVVLSVIKFSVVLFVVSGKMFSVVLSVT